MYVSFRPSAAIYIKMPDVNDMVLLQEYHRLGSEEAFARLVKRQLNLVYSVALRHVGIPAHAEEITQVVFAILARKAGALRPDTILEGWLHETTRLTALSFLRRERRRQLREQEACMESALHPRPDPSTWNHLAPLLDDALARLNHRDRDAIILRFFKDHSVREVAGALGVNENAAQQRILRAVEKLRQFFSRRGVVVPAAALTAAITAHSIQAAPVALPPSVAAFAIAHGAGASVSTAALINGALKTMAWTKVNIGIAGAVAAAVIVPLVVEHGAQAHLTVGENTLRAQAEQLASLRSDHDRLARLSAAGPAPQNSPADLQSLRDEVAALRRQSNEVAQLRDEFKQLRAQSGQDRPKPAGQVQAEMRAKMSYQKQWLLAFMIYAGDHDGQFPTNFTQVDPETADQLLKNPTLSTDQFEIVYTGTTMAITNPADTILLREKESWNAGAYSHPANQWAKTYGYADGHVAVHQEIENNFDDYERQHIVPPPSP